MGSIYFTHINISQILLKEEDPYVSKFMTFNTEILNCIEKLKVNMDSSINTISINTKVIQQNYKKINTPIGAHYLMKGKE